ncbi:hypothetical protein [Actinomadura violacea]|nr:hypothetical protein [Actinomadura violacea]
MALAWRGGRGRLWAVAALRSVSAVMLALIAPDLRRAPAASPAA